MSFSGIRAVVLIAVMIGLMLAVSRYDLPGWLVPLGLVMTAGVFEGRGKKGRILGSFQLSPHGKRAGVSLCSLLLKLLSR